MAFDMSKLGVKKNIPKVNFTSYSGLLIAPPKFGKTTTASYFPNSIIVPFEDGVKGQVANVVEDMNSWTDFIKFVDLLEENREDIGDNIETIVYDTVNEAWAMSEVYTLRKMSIADKKKYNKPADVPNGGFYAERDKIFKTQISRITSMGFALLFLTHSKVKTIRPKNGEAYDVYSSTMPDRLEAIINPLVDFMIYGERRVVDGEQKRVLVTKGTNMADAGNRVRLEQDIVFESEEEAMELYQVEFRKSIESLLKERGITESYEEISKQQKEEKAKEIKSYVKEVNEPTEKELVTSINAVIKTMTEEQQDEYKVLLKENFEVANYKKYGDTGKLQKALEMANGIVAE